MLETRLCGIQHVYLARRELLEVSKRPWAHALTLMYKVHGKTLNVTDAPADLWSTNRLIVHRREKEVFSINKY